MDKILLDTEVQLRAQQQELADRIRASEEALMRDKELYLKVTGALECVAILKQRKEEEDKQSDGNLESAGI